MNTLVERVRSLFLLLWRELAKFGTVGAVAFVIEASITYSLVHSVMVGSDGKARIVGATVATLFAWVASRLWTFRNRRAENKWAEAGKFFLINIIGMGISSGFTLFAKYVLHFSDATVLWMIGNVGVVVATVMRFFFYRFWVFNKELDEDPAFKDDHRLLDSVVHPEKASAHPETSSR